MPGQPKEFGVYTISDSFLKRQEVRRMICRVKVMWLMRGLLLVVAVTLINIAFYGTETCDPVEPASRPAGQPASQPAALPPPPPPPPPPRRAAEAHLASLNGCIIPEFQAFSPEVMKYYAKLPPHACSRQPALTSVDGDALKLNTTLLEERQETLRQCRYQAISRAPGDIVHYSRPAVVSFDSPVRPPADFIQVQCRTNRWWFLQRTYKEFHPILGLKPDLEALLPQMLHDHCAKKPRACISKGETGPQPLNVVMLGIDGVSRLNMMRHLDRLRQFLLVQLDAIEISNYNKIGSRTLPNMLPLLSGRLLTSIAESDVENNHWDTLGIKFLWDEFAEAGFRTLYAEDWPAVNAFEAIGFVKGFIRPPAHYYYRPMALAKNKNSGLFSDKRHCFGTQPEDEVILNYTLSFQRLFRNKPHFAYTYLTRSTHGNYEYGYVNGPSQIVDYHVNYLDRLVKEGLLSNTLLVLFSDHGIRWGGLRKTAQGRFEDNRPFMFLAFPPAFRKRHLNLVARVKKNAGRLVTPLDIYATIRDVLHGRFAGAPASGRGGVDSKGTSLFRMIPETRTCAEAGIPPAFCVCHTPTRSLDTSSPLARQAAQTLTATLNTVLYKAGVLGRCHPLSLKEVEEVLEMEPYPEVRQLCAPKNGSDVLLYRVSITTQPGEGRFEGLMLRCDPWARFSPHGQILRMNIFGSSSYCVTHHSLKEICYCRRQKCSWCLY